MVLGLLVCATGCAWTASTSPERMAVDPAADPAPPAMAPEAIEKLAGMTAFLSSRSAIHFEADSSYDAVQPGGEKLEFGSRRRVELRSPDRVRVEVAHRDGERELIVFDGTQVSAALLGQRVYASAPFAGNVEDAFGHLVSEYGVAAPLFDLLRRDLAERVAERAISGRDLGAVTLDGVRCDHLAFRGERIDFQLFVRSGAEPAPVRLVIDYRAEPGRPQFRADLYDWRFDTDAPDATFRLVPPPGAQRVPFPELLDLLLGPPEADETAP